MLKNYGPGVDDALIDRLAGTGKRHPARLHGVKWWLPSRSPPAVSSGVVRHLERFPEDVAVLRLLFWKKAYWSGLNASTRRWQKGGLCRDPHRPTRHYRQGTPVPGAIRVVEEGGEGVPELEDRRRRPPPWTGRPVCPGYGDRGGGAEPADLEWILKDMALAENILLIGEAGVGKNKLESYLAHSSDESPGGGDERRDQGL